MSKFYILVDGQANNKSYDLELDLSSTDEDNRQWNFRILEQQAGDARRDGINKTNVECAGVWLVHRLLDYLEGGDLELRALLMMNADYIRTYYDKYDCVGVHISGDLHGEFSTMFLNETMLEVMLMMRKECA